MPNDTWSRNHPDRSREINVRALRKKRGIKTGLATCPRCGRKIGLQGGSTYVLSRHMNQQGEWCFT